MSPSSEEPGTFDPRVSSALQEFLERKDRGEVVDHEQFLATHAEIADELRSFIYDSEDLARRASTGSAPAAEVSTNQSVSETIAPKSPGALPVLPEVFGRYRLQRLLGRGAMGAVYLAQDTQLARQVALKVPSFDNGQSEELLQRFYFEARAAATLRNPHICPVYDVGEIAGQHYISMAYIEGHSLSEVIRANGPQSERHVLLLIRKLALALQEAHDQGVIHRDLKPGNVMIDTRGEPVVMDFGLACQSREGAARITLSGVILGSPAYMPPEQLEGNSGKISPAADQYSLGVILYELLTGQLPFRGSISAVVSQIVIKPAPSPRVLRPELDPRVDQLCLQMLAKTPAERLTSMKAVAERIAAILKDPPKVEVAERAKGTQTAPTARTSGPSSTPRPTKPESSNPVSPRKSSPPTPAIVSDSTANRQHLSTLCLLAAKLIRKHDYAEAIRVLSSVPVESRSDELSDLLLDAEGKEEESNQLLQDVDLAIRTNRPKELPALVRRFLQLKPANKAMQTLAKDLQKWGAAQVISVRRKQRHVLDPAGQVWNPLHIAYFIVGLGLFCSAVYFGTIAFATPNGIVIIEVHDPRIAINFANDEITATSSGKKFRLTTTEKKTLQLEIDGVLVDSSTQEITVAQNETKLITARLVDGKLDLQINSEKKTFAVPGKEIAKKAEIKAGQKPDGGPAGVAGAGEWIDLLPAIDPEKASGSITRWTREGTVLTGTIVPSAKVGWIPLVTAMQIEGDYDVELDYLVVDCNYMQVALPLNETTVTVAIGTSGTGLQWIDGKDINWSSNRPPQGNSNLQMLHGTVQHFTASVRHQGENVTVETKLDGVVAGTFAGLRSRLSTPQVGVPVPKKIHLVAQFQERQANHRIEIHKARVRLVNSSTTAPPSTVAATAPKVDPPKPSQTQLPTPAPASLGAAANSRNVILDVDFQKTHGDFNQSDQDFILAEHKDGEYRYMGKKTGWWYGPLHPAFWLKENNQIRDFIMEVDLRIVSRKKGLFAIEFGQSGDGTLSLCVDQAGKVRLLHNSEDIVPATPSPVMRAVDQFNTLRLTVENKTVKVAVNGVALFEKRLDRYSGGTISLWLGPDEVPFDVRMRRIHLERIGPPPPERTQEIRRFKGHTAVVRGVAFLPDGLRAVSVGHDQAFKLWDVNTGGLLHDFAGHTGHVTSVSVSLDGKRALTGCWDTHVRLWDLENRTLLKTLKAHTGRVGSVLISRDGLTGLSVSNDGAVRQWDLKAGRSKLLPGPAPYGVLAMSLAENVVASGAGDGTILLRGPQGIAPLLGHGPGYIEGLAFTPDGSKLVTGGDDGTVRVWNLQDGKEIYKFETEGVGFDTVVVTNDGRYVIAGSCDQTIVGWDLETGKKVGTMHADAPVTHRLALSPDNQYVLSGGGDRAWKPFDDFDLRLWKLMKLPAEQKP